MVAGRKKWHGEEWKRDDHFLINNREWRLFSIFLTIAKDKQQPILNFHSNMLLNVYLSGLTIFLSVILTYCSGTQ